MTHLIIGCGYVGSAVASTWRQAGLVVAATTRSKEKKEELASRVDEVIVVPAGDVATLTRALEGRQTVLLSIAAGREGDYRDAYLGVANQLASALQDNRSVKQLIYTSSTSVYGADHKGATLTEESTPVGLSEKQEILLETEEQLLALANEERIVTVLRLAGIIGPNGRELTDLVRAMHKRGSSFSGDPSNPTNMVHLEDIVSTVVFSESRRLSGVYNVCSEAHPSRQQLYEKACEEAGLPPPQFDLSRPALHGGNRRISSEKLKQAGFTFSHTII